MPPSGEEIILSLLSRSVAKLENGDQKQKPEDEEVTFLKYVKKVKRQTESADKIADIVESLIVYFYLKEVSPKLAEELSAIHTFPLVSGHLKGISTVLTRNSSSQNRNKIADKRIKANKKTSTIVKRFTPLEDKVIKAAIEETGENYINLPSLVKRLNRPYKSVISRIAVIQRNGGVSKKMRFTLAEDIMLLDKLIIPRVGNEMLSKIVLSKHHYTDLTKELGKSPNAVLDRWVNSLQPWLLQHYSGTRRFLFS